MRGLQQAFADHSDVKLVSICLDPENDTPAALVHYAQRFQADADRWWFLTGTDEKYVHTLVEKGFLQSVVPAGDGTPLMHSTYMVVVDRAGRIRAAHDGLDRGLHDAIIRDVRALLAESLST
jgi:cytochrome oxidase Cu insertion factor (SCO1/SenC/PrrC family)